MRASPQSSWNEQIAEKQKFFKNIMFLTVDSWYVIESIDWYNVLNSRKLSYLTMDILKKLLPPWHLDFEVNEDLLIEYIVFLIESADSTVNLFHELRVTGKNRRLMLEEKIVDIKSFLWGSMSDNLKKAIEKICKKNPSIKKDLLLILDEE